MSSQLAYLKLSWCSGASYAPALYEPDWRSGKAVATRISKVDGRTMGIAALWSVWKNLNPVEGKRYAGFRLIPVRGCTLVA